MIRIRLGGSALAQTLAQLVSLAPLTATIAPAETVVGTPPSKIIDLSAASSAEGNVMVSNNASFNIFMCWGTPGTPNALSITTGVLFPANTFLTFDNVGGLCLWAISGTPQSAGSGVRSSGSYIA